MKLINNTTNSQWCYTCCDIETVTGHISCDSNLIKIVIIILFIYYRFIQRFCSTTSIQSILAPGYDKAMSLWIKIFLPYCNLMNMYFILDSFCFYSLRRTALLYLSNRNADKVWVIFSVEKWLWWCVSLARWQPEPNHYLDMTIH